jgi:hypothetical protein
MSVENFLNYEAYVKFMDRQVSIFGQPASFYTPTNTTALGYEDTRPSDIDKLDSDKVLGNQYKRTEGRIWINFTVNKSVFYRFNYFPEDSEELCTAFVNSELTLREGDYIRTATPEATSIWGSMLFSVRKIQDVGFSQVLQRIYFLKPTNNLDLQRELSF